MTRVIGPKEQYAIDSAPFGGLAQHYYALFLRQCDTLDRVREWADHAESLAQGDSPYWPDLYSILDPGSNNNGKH